MTLRRYQRSILATTCTEVGAIYCSILSFASDKRETSIGEITSTLLATRSKLKRASTLSTNIVYEFSLRGRWPKKRYQQILDMQMCVHFCVGYFFESMLTGFAARVPTRCRICCRSWSIWNLHGRVRSCGDLGSSTPISRVMFWL